MTNPCKVLWFINIPIATETLKGTGGWIESLAKMFQENKGNEYQLGICCIYPSVSNGTFTKNGHATTKEYTTKRNVHDAKVLVGLD